MIKSTTVGLNDIESCKGIIKTKSDSMIINDIDKNHIIRKLKVRSIP